MLPLLAPATVVVVALSVINSLKGFDILYIVTKGGPFHSSDTLAMYMYNESFKKYNMGYGSAISYALFPHMSVAENMTFGLRLAKEDPAVIEEKLDHVAGILQIHELLERKPKALSGGQ